MQFWPPERPIIILTRSILGLNRDITTVVKLYIFKALSKGVGI